MRRSHSTSGYGRWSHPSTFALVFAAILVLTLLIGSSKRPALHDLLANGDQGWIIPFSRSWLYALAAVSIELPIGFAAALVLRNSRSRGVMVLLLLPFLFGETGAGFIAKVLVHSGFAPDAFVERRFVAIWFVVLVSRFWQSIPFTTYLFWLRIRSIDPQKKVFAATSRLTLAEEARDVIWPDCRELAKIIATLAAVNCIQEFGMAELILSPSAGTATEFASHRLLRFYREAVMMDHGTAVAETAGYAVTFVVLSLFLLPLIAGAPLFLLRWILEMLSKVRAPLSVGVRRRDRSCLRNVGTWGLFTLTLGPFLPLFFHLPRTNQLAHAVSVMLNSALYAGAASLLCVSAAVSVTALRRLSSPLRSERLDRLNTALFSALLGILVIPPIGVAVTLTSYLLRAGMSGSGASALTWIAAQCVFAFPLAALFLFWIHSRVRTPEIVFQGLSRVSAWEAVRISFRRRFASDYLLAVLVIFVLMIHEDNISSFLSSSVPSLAVEISQRVDGRAGSFREATGLLLVSMIPAAMVLSLWMTSPAARSEA